MTCYPDQQRPEHLFTGWAERAANWLELIPLFPSSAIAALVDRDQPPFAQSFLKVRISRERIEGQMFRVEDFTKNWTAAPPHETFTCT